MGAGGGGMLVDEMRRGQNGREASREQGAGSRSDATCIGGKRAVGTCAFLVQPGVRADVVYSCQVQVPTCTVDQDVEAAKAGHSLASHALTIFISPHIAL